MSPIKNSNCVFTTQNAIKWKDNKVFHERGVKVVFEELPCRWRIEVFNEGNGSIMLKVALINDNKSEEVEEKMFFKIQAFIVRGPTKSAWKRIESTEMELKNVNYFEKFIEKPSNIESLLNNGKDFEVEVFVTISKLEVDETIELAYDSTDDKLEVLKHLETLYMTSNDADICISFGDTKFNLHREILAARSKFFERQLNGTFNGGCLEFGNNDEIDEETLNSLFKFIYTGEADFHSLETAQTLMRCGNSMDIPDLQEVYENVLKAHTNDKNALDMLFKAVSSNSRYGLKEKAFGFIKKRYENLGIFIPTTMMDTPKEIVEYASDAMVKMVEDLTI